jgi:hypothetical protein
MGGAKAIERRRAAASLAGGALRMHEKGSRFAPV